MSENEGGSRNSEGIELKTLNQISGLLNPNFVVGKIIYDLIGISFHLKVARGMMIPPIRKMHWKQMAELKMLSAS